MALAVKSRRRRSSRIVSQWYTGLPGLGYSSRRALEISTVTPTGKRKNRVREGSCSPHSFPPAFSSVFFNLRAFPCTVTSRSNTGEPLVRSRTAPPTRKTSSRLRALPGECGQEHSVGGLRGGSLGDKYSRACLTFSSARH